MLMGHKKNLGLDINYFRPKQNQLIQEYLKIEDDLTINDENRLSKQVQELKEKNEDAEYVIKGKLQEKDDQLNAMKETYDTELKILKEAILDMQELMKYPKKLSKF